jgi:hypothetical protein
VFEFAVCSSNFPNFLKIRKAFKLVERVLSEEKEAKKWQRRRKRRRRSQKLRHPARS